MTTMQARYEGKPMVEFLEDGQTVRLVGDFAFIDLSEQRWAVPAGAVVDGASIPRIFWSVIGGPLDGNYRDASIVHDWYCDRRTRTWQATHRVFYEAMLVSGVPIKKAKIMYFAVRWRGPRWEERVILNTRLPLGPGGHFNFSAGLTTDAVRARNFTVIVAPLVSPGEGFDAETQIQILKEVASEIEGGRDHDLHKIDDFADALKCGGQM